MSSANVLSFPTPSEKLLSVLSTAAGPALPAARVVGPCSITVSYLAAQIKELPLAELNSLIDLLHCILL